MLGVFFIFSCTLSYVTVDYDAYSRSFVRPVGLITSLIMFLTLPTLWIGYHTHTVLQVSALTIGGIFSFLISLSTTHAQLRMFALIVTGVTVSVIISDPASVASVRLTYLSIEMVVAATTLLQTRWWVVSAVFIWILWIVDEIRVPDISDISVLNAAIPIFSATLFAIFLRSRLDRKVHQAVRLTNEVSDLAQTDPLTGLYNRRGLRQHGDVNTVHTAAFIDINGLKTINDTYGHEAGDLTISAVAASLQAVMRQTDVVCRWGGDEFLVLSTDTISSSVLEKRLNIWLADNTDNEWTVSVSVGTSTLAGSQSLADLIDEADENMYALRAAKRC